MNETISRAIPVRMDDEVILKLDEMAATLGLTRSFLMRLAIKKLVEDFTVTGGLELTGPNGQTKARGGKK